MSDSRLQEVINSVTRRPGAPADSSVNLTGLSQSLSSGTNQALPNAITDVSQQIQQWRTTTQNQSDLITANTQALTQNTSAQSKSGGVGSVIEQGAKGILGSILSAFPLVSAITSLFSGGPSTPPPLVKYASPPSVAINAAVQGQREDGALVYDQYGNPRGSSSDSSQTQTLSALMPQATAPPAGAGGSSSNTGAPTNPGASSNTGGRGATNVTVNVQAMDSRSFLDRSNDIADAVRAAMLNTHSINDVVNDL